MECNKDEALRAKKIAERKITIKDMVGAMKFALKAQSLFPELDCIQQLVATIQVHIAAEKQVKGEPDWYAILGVDSKATDDAVRRQYRKLALTLHPDKNKVIGGDVAFKLVSQAWSLLSDKARRMRYDQNKDVKSSQKVPGPSRGSSAAPEANGFHNCTKSRSGQPSNKTKGNTFWTVCHRCRMQYEYLRNYLNHNLLCPNCQVAFVAVEIPPPPSSGKKSPFPNKFSQQRGFFGTGGAAASAVHQAQKKGKRDRVEALAANKREEALRRKNTAKIATGHSDASKRKGSVGMNYQQKDQNQMGSGTGISGSANPSCTGEAIENKMMVKKARMEIRNKLDKVKFDCVSKDAGKEDRNHKENANGNIVIESFDRENESFAVGSSHDGKSSGELDQQNESSPMKISLDICCTDGEAIATLSVDVPSSDFHDFNKARTEKSIGENQVWAVYDDGDGNGMPRHYAMVHHVISLDPFKLRIRWLSPRTSSTFELGLLNWIASGFSLTCGGFQLGRRGIINSLDSLSHQVRWSKDASGVIRVLPRKGDVWAVYRNWSRNWNELTEFEVIHRYEIVEVVQDYGDAEQGVIIIPLVKVAGFRALFHRHLDFREIRKVPKEEMCRFSHFIPSFLHLGQEAPNAPKGCWELDPAATPEEFLQDMAEPKDEEIIGVEEVDVIDI